MGGRAGPFHRARAPRIGRFPAKMKTESGTFRSRCLALGCALCAAAVLLACGCGGQVAGTPEEIVEKAIESQGELKTVHMEMETDVEVRVPGANRSTAIAYEGDYEQPDKWRLDIRASGGKSEVIIMGSSAWVKLPGATTWTARQGVDYVEGGAEPGDIISSEYLESATDVRLVDQKDETYHLTMSLDMGSYAEKLGVPGADPSAFREKMARMELWIRKKDYLMKTAVMDFSGNVTGAENGDLSVRMQVEFSDFNEPVSIEPPV